MKKLIVLLFILFNICSCSDTDYALNEGNKGVSAVVELTQHEYVSLYEDGIKELENNDVKNLVSSFIDEIQNVRGETKSNSQTSRKISIINLLETKSTSDKEEIPFYYLTIEENDQKGFSIVAANKCFPEVIAYVPKGDLKDTTQIGGMQFMYKLAVANAKEKLKDFRLKKDSLKNVAVQKIGDKLALEPNQVLSNLKSVNIAVVGDPEKMKNLKSYNNYIPVPWGFCRLSILKTEWGQEYPYNGLHPVSPCESHNNLRYRGRYYAGCVITACAQFAAIGKYKNPSSTTNLSGTTHVPANPANAHEQRMHDEVMNLTNEIRQLLKVNYDCGGTGASTPDAVKLLGRYNLKGKEIKPILNTTVANTDLIWMRADNANGEGHSFILDGHCQYYMSGRDDAVFVNLGWSGSGNGWYIVRGFATAVGFDNNIRMWSISRTD